MSQPLEGRIELNEEQGLNLGARPRVTFSLI